MIHDQVRGRLLDDPGDMGVRKALAQRGERGQGMDNIADGAEFDDQNVHFSRSFMIHVTASRILSAI